MSTNAVVARHIRPFVSSTFLDLKRERNALVSRAFPRVRKHCEMRGVTWSAVDLRWGVTSEHKILPICLDEVSRSRPFFICVLGERYGTVFESIPNAVRIRYPWLERYPQRSLTELEIILGALEESAEPANAFFYFRHPSCSAMAPREERRDHRSADSESSRRLKRLKERIRERYPRAVRAGFRSPEELATWVEEDLKRRIDELFPENSAPSPREQYALDQQIFAMSRRRVYVPDPNILLDLDVYATGASVAPLMLTGESGSGKSALLANWATDHAKRNPQDLTTMHFVGGGDSGGRVASVLRQLIYGLGEAIGERTDEALDDLQLKEAFVRVLGQASVKRRVIVIIDGLDQLEDEPGALDLTWLPQKIAANVRVVVSAAPGRCVDAAKARNWRIVRLADLTSEQAAELARRYLDAYGKRDGLTPAQFDAVTRARQAGNALFLCTLLDELVLLDSREAVDQAIAEYLDAESIPALFEKVLSRFERDYQSDRPGLIKDALSLIWASRRGLGEAELMDLLGENGQPLPSAHWSGFAIAADRLLLARSGLLGFSHSHLRAAVEQKFLKTDVDKRSAHLALAAYFRDRPVDQASDMALAVEGAAGQLWRKRLQASKTPVDRHTEEYPWQLERAQRWPELGAWLSTPPNALFAFLKARPDMLRYWAQLEQNSTLRATQLFQHVLESPERHRYEIALATVVLFSLGRMKELEALVAKVVARMADGSQEYAAALFTHVNALTSAGDFDQAQEVCNQALSLFRQANDGVHQAQTLRLLSDISLARGDPDGALALEMQAAALLQQLNVREEANLTFRVQAKIHLAKGDAEAARAAFDEGVKASRSEGDPLGEIASLSQLGDLLVEMNRKAEAEDAYDQAEKALLELGEPDLLSVFYFNRAAALQKAELTHDAEKWYDKSEAYAQQVGNAKILAMLRLNRATELFKRDKNEQALESVRLAIDYFRDAGLSELGSLYSAINLEALILSMLGREEEADRGYAESLEIARRTQSPDHILHALGNYALRLLAKRSDWKKALPLLQEARGILDRLPASEVRAGIVKLATLAADKIGGHMLALEIDREGAGEELAEQLRQWCQDWKLPTAGVHFIARDAARAALRGEKERALSLTEQATGMLTSSGDDQDGHDTLRRSLIYLADTVNPSAKNLTASLPQALTIINMKERILRALGAKEELVRCHLIASTCMTMMLELLPLEIDSEARAALAAAGAGPNQQNAHAMAVDVARRAIFATDQAAHLARLYQPVEEKFGDSRTPPKQQPEILLAYGLIAEALAKRAAKLDASGAKREACEMLVLRSGVARITQETGAFAATLAELAFKHADVGETEMARETAADAAALAQKAGDAALVERLAPLLETAAPPMATETPKFPLPQEELNGGGGRAQ